MNLMTKTKFNNSSQNQICAPRAYLSDEFRFFRDEFREIANKFIFVKGFLEGVGAGVKFYTTN
jgi:hypothetical protein